ncbi:MAG: protein kinase [Chloroflexota bacterium]
MTATINGRYHLQEKLGQGGMGIVHRATDRLTGEIVALKQVFLPVEQIMFASRPIAQTNHELRLALAHEFQTLAGLRHPNIISVLDYGFDENKQPFFTMTYLENAQTILAAANGRSVSQKADLLIQILQALAYLHRRGILHRDLKPDNVLVVGNTVRVLDFGLAVTKEQATESVGSWLYMAPEVLLGQPASEASDLYAAGVLAYRLFANDHPFNIYAEDVTGEILTGEPKWEKMGDNAALTAVIRALLAKTPAARPPTASHVISTLNTAVGRAMPPETAVIRESYLQAATFVGREGEMQQLTAALNQTKQGYGSAWLIGGESGVGKTRLLRELETLALVDGFLVLRGQAIRDGGGLTYHIWREAVRHLLIVSPAIDRLTASVLLPLVPDMEQLLGQAVPPAPAIEEGSAQVRLFTTIARLFRQQTQPILLLLEDLQWAEESLLPLPYLTRLVTEQPLLIIGTYRDDERPELPQALPTMEQLALPRLTEQNVAELTAAMLGEPGQQAELLALLQKETEGNTFFLVEIVRALAEEAGQLAAIGRTQLPHSLMPEGIQTIINRRLGRVPEIARPLLLQAAVAGRQLDLALLRNLAPKMDVDHWWLSVCAETAVLEVQGNQWQFSHDKLREGLLAKAQPAKLKQSHQQIALTLEKLYGEDANHAAQLAYHWGQAEALAQERHYSFLAGRHAAAQYANEEALNYFTRALTLTPATDLEGRYALYLAREQIYNLLARREEQAADLAQLTQLAAHLADPNRQIDILLRQANYAFEASQLEQAKEIAQEAISLFENLGVDSRTVTGYLTWGKALHWQGQYEVAQSVLEQGLAVCRQVGDLRLEASALRELAYLRAEMDAFEQSRRDCEASLAIACQIGDRWEESKILNILGIWAGLQQLYAEANAQFTANLLIRREIGDRQGEAEALSNLGNLAVMRRLYDLARQYCEDSFNIYYEIGYEIGFTYTSYNLGNAMAHYGAYEEAVGSLKRGLALLRELGLKKSWWCMALGTLGYALLCQGEDEQAQACFDEGIALAQEIKMPVSSWEHLNYLGYLRERQGDLVSAQAYYQEAFLVTQSERSYWAVQSQAGLAYMAVMLGQDPEPHLGAVLHYLAQNPELGLTEQPGRVYLHLYLALDSLGDARAKNILTQAYNFLQEMAAQIKDTSIQQSLLENVMEYREIMRLYEERVTG